ncbi:MAG TPA: DUF4160 domain-containing protein [Micromonosporaceae bacterium]|nr:DUF4160 domain-containing protein [Micromonosporaceae bacterium]
MPLGLRSGNFAVYVYDERGQRHHLPHAHIKQGQRRVASIFLLSLEVYDNREPLPKALLEAIRAAQEDLMRLWRELNGDD